MFCFSQLNDKFVVFIGFIQMFSYTKLTIFVTIISLVTPLFGALAIDFDKDGVSDFVLVNINDKGKLDWSAIDVNDSARRSLGQFGNAGNHLAVGDWSADATTSKALVSRKSTGEFEWNIELPSGKKSLMFGTYPSKVVSGLDFDNNGAIDPALLSEGDKTYDWKIMGNPGIAAAATVSDVSFGSKNGYPFFANLEGRGDGVAVASVTKKGTLIIRYRAMDTGKIKKVSVPNFPGSVIDVLPIALKTGSDALFVVSNSGGVKKGTIINGKKKVRRVKISGSDITVGNYLGTGTEIVAVKSDAASVTFIDLRGGKSNVPLDLNGIVVDDININGFGEPKDTGGGTPGGGNDGGGSTPQPSKRPPNASCTGGILDSTQHLLYKPVSDTSGNAVIVFDSKYSREFTSVKIQLRDGTFLDGWWHGLELWGNPDSFGPRQHWRTNVRASQVADNALIIASDLTQECRFQIPGSSSRRWE